MNLKRSAVVVVEMVVLMSMILFIFIHWKLTKIEPPWSNPIGT